MLLPLSLTIRYNVTQTAFRCRFICTAVLFADAPGCVSPCLWGQFDDRNGWSCNTDLARQGRTRVVDIIGSDKREVSVEATSPYHMLIGSSQRAINGVDNGIQVPRNHGSE